MNDDESQALFRSMVDERILLLGRLKAHQDRWDKVVALTSQRGRIPALNILIQIHAVAEEALTL